MRRNKAGQLAGAGRLPVAVRLRQPAFFSPKLNPHRAFTGPSVAPVQVVIPTPLPTPVPTPIIKPLPTPLPTPNPCGICGPQTHAPAAAGQPLIMCPLRPCAVGQ